ncbi:hypothetical protein L9F63_012127, partial [Diploptera punctata]
DVVIQADDEIRLKIVGTRVDASGIFAIGTLMDDYLGLTGFGIIPFSIFSQRSSAVNGVTAMNMGKFPGKPSKIVNRKRVKASKCSSSQENDSVKAAENIYFGLAVFNEAFGSEQVTTEFLGFTPQEAKAAVVYAKKKQREVITEYEANGLHISLKENFERELAYTQFNIAYRSRRKASGVRRTYKQHSADNGGKPNTAAKKLLQKAKKSSAYGSALTVDSLQHDKGNKAEEVLSDKENVVGNHRTRTHASSTESTRSVHSASDKELSTDSECGRLSKSFSSDINSGKIILRKARLKLNTQTTAGTEGPFLKINITGGLGNTSLPGTVVCGVCGAVRFYRFVKQARKFGIFSCESCRKFISKMMKRQACTKGANLPILECHKGAGMCSVPPIVRSQQWKPGRGTQLRCSYKARCPACWLKMCLRSFNMPDTLRENLSLMLPPEMRKGLDKFSLNHLSMDTSGLKTGFFTNQNDGVSAFNSGIRGSKKLGKSKDNPDSSMERLRKKKNSGVKVRKKNGQKFVGSVPGSDMTRRQRLDLKGPRVKHVCRSASIVLGQPQATFPVDKKLDKIQPKQVEESVKVSTKSSCCADCTGPNSSTVKMQDSERNSQNHFHGDVSKSGKLATVGGSDVDSMEVSEPARSQSSTDVASSSQDEEPVPVTSSHRRTAKPSTVSSAVATSVSVTSTLPIAGNLVRTLPRTVPEPQHLVSIDFWESYDPEEVCNTGFG